MKKIKKFVVIGAVVLVVAALSVTAFAAAKYSSPAEAAAGLTGRTLEDVVAERTETDKTYGAISNEAGKLEEFKAELLEIRKEALAEKVADGRLTQEQADEILAAITENIANCDGSGSLRLGQQLGVGFGNGNGKGMGRGLRDGSGQGMRQGSCDGSGQGMRMNGSGRPGR